jgi:hypothetical protein
MTVETRSAMGRPSDDAARVPAAGFGGTYGCSSTKASFPTTMRPDPPTPPQR